MERFNFHTAEIRVFAPTSMNDSEAQTLIEKVQEAIDDAEGWLKIRIENVDPRLKVVVE